ncbi:MAG: LysM peptidoglycan-binding domain-containing protein [Chloroflexi bacterium AL-W]|nr:LysM peptidoglycan-binding domain-containing protein [Chloroflexi bacterium AL-N1]NOK64551.1 LysM peptidoglycan-binding domain-containing protein [Chloroflexi bacterium AL-N10]NOK75793.1 LysM peptidoglycan-binding domain-containing protein [Chloroflexi bacterium AL-N5]NOK80448.1 LysM peptidoglycan-binding domain-containing protein [Chloroflexi bacterium AL-W]NOK86962.1 LysM peptidoglycan-binding domain-containing protein [Chloroflexi bacterium AL-N15]
MVYRCVSILWRWCIALLFIVFSIMACAPPEPDTPRPTAAAVLAITAAPTQDIDATATVYASQLIPTPTPAGLYIVQPGDTIGSLAEAFGTTIEEILAANGTTDPDSLQSGQALLIPSLISDTLQITTEEEVDDTVSLTPRLTNEQQAPNPTLTTP